jgi:hypothetical protein
VVPYATPVVLVSFALLLFLAWKRGRLGLTFIGVAVVLSLLWGLALAAIWTDYRDADGFIDCWPSCSHYQHTVEWAFWYGPVVFVVLGVFAGVLGTITARRESRSIARRPR